jgi:hypothetical protein
MLRTAYQQRRVAGGALVAAVITATLLLSKPAAPDAQLTTLDGERVRLASSRLASKMIRLVACLSETFQSCQSASIEKLPAPSPFAIG